MSGTTAPLRAVPYDRYNGTIGAIFSTIYHILECNGLIMASVHTDYIYDAVDIRVTTYKNYRYDV